MKKLLRRVIASLEWRRGDYGCDGEFIPSQYGNIVDARVHDRELAIKFIKYFGGRGDYALNEIVVIDFTARGGYHQQNSRVCSVGYGVALYANGLYIRADEYGIFAYPDVDGPCQTVEPTGKRPPVDRKVEWLHRKWGKNA